jgi:hypothetical protein
MPDEHEVLRRLEVLSDQVAEVVHQQKVHETEHKEITKHMEDTRKTLYYGNEREPGLVAQARDCLNSRSSVKAIEAKLDSNTNVTQEILQKVNGYEVLRVAAERQGMTWQGWTAAIGGAIAAMTGGGLLLLEAFKLSHGMH